MADRFAFGANWRRFLRVLDDERIEEASRSLQVMLDRDLTGRSFLDVGSGSGLFSLAAVRLGAARVHSLDYDPESVACTAELKRRYFPDLETWTVERGNALDTAYLDTLGRWDVVYSWGVLHHTGRMWDALANVAPLVAPRGQLFISIYNDQGRRSRLWSFVKRGYNAAPRAVRTPYVVAVMAPYEIGRTMLALATGHPRLYVESWTRYKSARGMSRWRDHVDWVGGWPYEVARPDEIFDFFRQRGFTLQRLHTPLGWGTNEYVFERDGDGPPAG